MRGTSGGKSPPGEGGDGSQEDGVSRREQLTMSMLPGGWDEDRERPLDLAT